jgi:hypothetical protein
MKVVKKSPASRHTLTLPARAMALLDEMRGKTPKSRYVERLLESEAEQRKRKIFYARAVAAYTPEVCRETLALNAEYPVHDE